MRRLFLILLMCISWLPAFAQEPSVTRTKLILSQREDPLARYAARISAEAFRRSGIETEFRTLPSERALQAADSGQTAGDQVRVAGLEKLYPNLVQVPVPMLNYHTVVFTAGMTFRIDGWESLKPYSLCILRGMKLAETATESMDRTIANDVAQSILMLKAGRCKVAVLGYNAWPEIDRMRAGPLLSLDPPINSVPLYLYVNKKHADLVPSLAQALQKMQVVGFTSGVLNEMEQEIQAARQRNAMPAR